jgi:hypothetical protein
MLPQSNPQEPKATPAYPCDPTWCTDRMQSALDVWTSVAAQGAITLVSEPAYESFELLNATLKEKLGDEMAVKLADLVNDSLTQAIYVAARLGAAVATTPMRGSFESWLQRAIDEAGLRGYKVGDAITGMDSA